MFIPTKGRTLILKMVEREIFFLQNQSIYIIYPNEENMFMVPHHEKKRLLVNSCLSQLSTNFDSKKWWEVKFSLWNQSINSFILIRRMNLWCLIIKKRRLLCESVFMPIERWTLILKVVEREVFVLKPKLYYHLS